jgi:hypothetical protein
MANRIGGTSYLYIDGRQLPLRGNFTCSPSLIERTGVVGLDRPHGNIEVPRLPFVEADISLAPGQTVEDIEGVEDATVTAELANNMVITLRNAWCRSAIEINAHDGSYRVRFEGMGVQQFAG